MFLHIILRKCTFILIYLTKINFVCFLLELNKLWLKYFYKFIITTETFENKFSDNNFNKHRKNYRKTCLNSLSKVATNSFYCLFSFSTVFLNQKNTKKLVYKYFKILLKHFSSLLFFQHRASQSIHFTKRGGIPE